MRYIVIGCLMFLCCVSCSKGPKKSIAEIKDAIDSTVMNAALYEAFSIVAKNDSIAEIAVIFDAMVDAQTVNLLKLEAVLAEYGINDYKTQIESVGADTSLLINIRRAIEIEDHKAEITFPQRIAVVTNDGTVSAAKVFMEAKDDARDGSVIIANALANIDSLQFLAKEYFVCSKCGKIYVTKAPVSCERCGVGIDDFYVKRSSEFPSRVIRDTIR